MVIAPFLTARALERFAATGDNHVLVSRQEMLDAIDPHVLARFAKTYFFSDAASQPDVFTVDVGDQDDAVVPLLDEMRGDAIDAELQGLHAKLIVAEYQDDVCFYTGSANATDAAFGGNVEFLVELRTREPGVGVDGLLAQPDGVTSLRDLIEPYTPRHQGPPEESDEAAVSRVLDVARRALGALHFTATLMDQDGETFALELRGDGQLRLPDEVDAFGCWPITRGQGHQVTPRSNADGLSAAFGVVSRAGITSFFAFEVRARRGSATDDVRFVVNAELVGAPAGRADDVLTQILHSRQDVLRYLLFLLADMSRGPGALLEALGAIGKHGADGSDHGVFETPLFETLMRALARDPSRLDHIERLLHDLRSSGRADALVPEGLEALWDPIWEVRQELMR
jgi:hypothetical protein